MSANDAQPNVRLPRRESALKRSVDLATDGASAVGKWSAGEYDLVLMDCQLPGMDGCEAARHIREAETASGRHRTPILALTANAFAEDRAICLAARMDDFLTKPVLRANLATALARWFEPADTGDPVL